MFDNEKGKLLMRVCFRLLVAGYLILIAIKQFQALADTTSPRLTVTFSILFFAAGIGFAGYALYRFIKEGKCDKNSKKE